MDLKVMPRSHKGHKYILCIINELTNYLITVPIFQARSEEIGEALIENVITKYCIPEYIIKNQDSAFMSSLMTYLLDQNTSVCVCADMAAINFIIVYFMDFTQLSLTYFCIYTLDIMVRILCFIYLLFMWN